MEIEELEKKRLIQYVQRNQGTRGATTETSN